MYSLSPGRQSDKFEGAEIADFIIGFGCSKVSFGMKECYSREWLAKELSLPQQRRLLIEAVEYLVDNHGFFTIECAGKLLVIPFEDGTFNAVVDDDAVLPVVPRTKATDVTAVLRDYRDMYDNYGIDRVFRKIA